MVAGLGMFLMPFITCQLDTFAPYHLCFALWFCNSKLLVGNVLFLAAEEGDYTYLDFEGGFSCSRVDKLGGVFMGVFTFL